MAHSTKPYQSRLNPFTALIEKLRSTKPPTPFARIADILESEHGVKTPISTLYNFVRVRSRPMTRGITIARERLPAERPKAERFEMSAEDRKELGLL